MVQPLDYKTLVQEEALEWILSQFDSSITH